ncbi:hypothetical protein ACRAWC_09455 [Leifsonia sp. L25]
MDDESGRPTREECMRASGRVLLQIAIRLELERREAEAAQLA